MKLERRSVELPIYWPRIEGRKRHLIHRLLPTPGNVLFTLLVVAGLLWATSVGALPLRAPAAASTSTGTIAYQGRLADADGNPLTGTYNMIFRLYDVASGGVPLWEEQWTGSNGVRVSDGLFNVILGSLTPIPQSVITGHDSLFLGITVGTDDEMTPRVQLGSVPFAVQALTVPDGSVTTEKIADRAVTSAKLNVDNGMSVSGTLTVTNNIAIGSGSDLGGNNYGRVAFKGSSGSIYLRSAYSGLTGGHALAVDLQNDSNSLLEIIRQGVGSVAYIKANSDFVASGSKSAIVRAGEFGQRKLYAAESPEVRFFDEGLARLKGGMARVTLDPVFLETIEGDYLVHVTPYGDASLYVAEIGRDYFVVKAREGDPNVAFAWRLSATRKGYAGVRLEEVATNTDKDMR